MKLHLVLPAVFSLLLICTSGAAQQQPQRIYFKRGATIVSGTIKADEIRKYVFRVKKNADVEISVDNETIGPQNLLYPKFELLKPNGELFYTKDSVNYGIGTDLMDVLPQAGDYTIRLRLPEDMRNNGKPVKFTFRVIIK